jgi:hypothetical protein
LIDLTGKIITDEISQKESFVINVEKLKKGVYIFKMVNGKGINVSLEKIIIQ